MRQRQEATAGSASKPAATPDPIKPMATRGIETIPRSNPATVAEQLHRAVVDVEVELEVMARRAVQLEEGLVHIMAVSGVGNTPMARATNS